MIYNLIVSLCLTFGSCGTDDAVKKTEIPSKPDGKEIYIPNDLKTNDFSNSSSKWCWERSKASENWIVFWEAGFGKDPKLAAKPYTVDIDDLLAKAEGISAHYTKILKFIDTENSNTSKYRMMIFLSYSTEWNATGAGYDDVIGSLWINPSSAQPVGSVVAHEIGHCFQYQVYADLLASGKTSNDFSRGFRYGFGGNGGNGFWEQTAQWQSFQMYPSEAFDSYNFKVYTENYHRHISHEYQRYASYFIHYYWAEKHGIDFIGKLWREAKSPEDPTQAYMRLNGLTVDQLNTELYDAATHFVTWDLDLLRSNGSNFIGKQTYNMYKLNDGSYQVAYNRCPGSTGYNVIPLNVPATGTIITTKFTGLAPGIALAPGDPGTYTDEEKSYTTTKYNSCAASRAGWRYGYVALLNNGKRVYGEMNQKTTADIQFTIPEGCSKLWLVVLGAPTTYEPHPWDEKESNDDQWPYTLKFTNTNLWGYQ